MKIKIQKLDPRATFPAYAHPGDAGMDLFALENTPVKAGEIKAIKTGIAMEIPMGFVGLIWDKGGISMKGGLKVMGGVVDAGYRGEIMIGIANLSGKEYLFEAGHKVTQMLVQKVESPELVEANELTETKRGKGAFGSTGK